MKQIKVSFLILTIFFTCIFTGYLFPPPSAAKEAEQWIGKIVSLQGAVQARRVGKTTWQTVKLNDTFYSGDMIRVRERSRAAFVLSNETIVRLDQKTTITFSGLYKERTSLIDLVFGAAHFFSRVSRSLRVTTPFVNGAVEGTEFFVKVGRDQTFLSVFQGRVLATNEAGGLVLTDGQSTAVSAKQAPALHKVIRPRDAVQWALYYPAVLGLRPEDFANGTGTGWQGMVQKSIEFFWKGDLARAFSSLEDAPDNIRDPRYYNYLAGLLLTVGRAKEAGVNIEKALDIEPLNSQATAIKSIIALTQNKKDMALDLARRAVEMDAGSSAALIALSYAEQANFQLQNALASIKKTVNLDPGNGLAWSRLSELWLSMGDIDRAVKAAREAVKLNSNIAHTQTVLGFAFLTQIRTKDALSTFKRAIELDQAAPLPRLGMGLAKIRKGNLKEGRAEIAIAAILDPNNSLIRSYLGKAYFEEKRNGLAMGQLAIAKDLDPSDPTPWFYDAIRKQTENRPVEALQDLEKSIELNDNRAVYRSSLMLDEDLAARSASLARIYNDLGFLQLALAEGWKSLNTDPANYSAHRFLADSYAVLPRHKIARVSEILQSQLLQPINIIPVPPQLAKTGLFILEGAGPTDPSFNEFTSLFNRNRFSLQTSGIGGGDDTLGDELVVSGVLESISYSVGQFHYETDGFRDNNDLKQDIYSAFIQGNITDNTSIQAEFRDTERKNGDLELRFNPDLSTHFREKQKVKSLRFGFNIAASPNSNIIGSIIHHDVDFDINDLLDEMPGSLSHIDRQRDGYMAELQYILRLERMNFVWGIGHVNNDLETSFTAKLGPPLFADILIPEEDINIRYSNVYMYSQIDFSEHLNLTAGLSADFFERGKQIDRDQVNPKLGLTWQPLGGTTIRIAAFRELSSILNFIQTIEPTQIAGFNQFFEDINGTYGWRYGGAVDQKFSSSMFGGMEYSQRALDVPLLSINEERAEFYNWEEQFGRAYLYWTPHTRLALISEYQFERFDRRDNSIGQEIVDVKTHRVSFGINLFHPSGLSAGLKTNYIHQSGNFQKTVDDPVFSGQDNFWVLDTRISYRLGKRLGMISIGIKNLLDKDFNYHDTDPENPVIIPQRFIYARVSLSF